MITRCCFVGLILLVQGVAAAGAVGPDEVDREADAPNLPNANPVDAQAHPSHAHQQKALIVLNGRLDAESEALAESFLRMQDVVGSGPTNSPTRAETAPHVSSGREAKPLESPRVEPMLDANLFRAGVAGGSFRIGFVLTAVFAILGVGTLALFAVQDMRGHYFDNLTRRTAGYIERCRSLFRKKAGRKADRA